MSEIISDISIASNICSSVHTKISNLESKITAGDSTVPAISKLLESTTQFNNAVIELGSKVNSTATFLEKMAQEFNAADEKSSKELENNFSDKDAAASNGSVPINNESDQSKKSNSNNSNQTGKSDSGNTNSHTNGNDTADSPSNNTDSNPTENSSNENLNTSNVSSNSNSSEINNHEFFNNEPFSDRKEQIIAFVDTYSEQNISDLRNNQEYQNLFDNLTTEESTSLELFLESCFTQNNI